MSSSYPSERCDYYPVKLGTSRTETEDNVLIDCQSGYLQAAANDVESTFQINDICNTPDAWNDLGNNSSAFVATQANSTHYATAAAAGYTASFTFTRDKFTSHPAVVTLTNAVAP